MEWIQTKSSNLFSERNSLSETEITIYELTILGKQLQYKKKLLKWRNFIVWGIQGIAKFW